MLRGVRSIRTTLTLWYSLILLTTLVAFGLAAYTYSTEQLQSNLDRSLRNEVKWVNNFIAPKASKVKPSKKFASKRRPGPAPAETPLPSDEEALTAADEEIWNQIYEHAVLNPKKTLIEVADPAGAIIFRSYSVGGESLMVGEVPPDTVKILTVRNEKGEDLRVAATANSNLRIYVAYPLAELSEALDNLFSIFLILIPIALTVSVAGGWFLANKSLKPVDSITRTARQITAQNLDQRIPSPEVDDEIGRLVSTFNEMIARLRGSFDQIRQFSVDASHELRTPLTIMRGEVELLMRSSELSEDVREVLSSLLEEIARLTTIIESLLSISAADGRVDDAKFAIVDLRELLHDIYEDSEILAERKNIAVTFEYDEPVTIAGDRLRLRQLFLNLVDNAIKYTPDRGKVRLSLHRDNGFARIAVKDSGIGIDPAHQERIFDRFYRVDRGRSREMGGSGLGLSISRWIAALHNGRIEVESDLDKGSTFTVYLPLR